MASGRNIVRNTTFLTSAFIVQKILAFIYFTLIARFVGVVDTGAYVFALSYATIFSVMVDFGLGPLIQREIAQNQEKTKIIVCHALFVKMFYTIIAVGAGVLIITLLVNDFLLLRMVYIAMVLMVVDSFNQTLWSAFRGHHKLQYESVAVIISQIVVLVIGLLGLVAGFSLEILIIALLAGSLFVAFYATIQVRRKLKFWTIPVRGENMPIGFIKESIPFGLAGVFTRIFSSIDSVLLRQLSSQAAVGFYSIPNKVVFAAQFIPSAFAAAIYPAMSHHYKHDKNKMVQVFEYSLLFLLVLAVPMAVGIFVLTPILITELYTDKFSSSIPAMYILVWGIIFGFAEFPIGALLNAIGQQRKNMITRGVVMLTNVILNVLLIPLYSFIGAAVAALVSYGLLTAIGIYWVRKYVDVNWSSLNLAIMKIAIASTLMGIIVYGFLPYLHFTLLIVLGMLIYALVMFSMKVVDHKKIVFLFDSFKK